MRSLRPPQVSDLDPDGYSLTLDDQAAQRLAPNGSNTVASLTVGTHTVTLAGVASNCVLGGANPRTVDVAAGEMARLRFEIACSQVTPGPGAVQVSVPTTGDDPDPNGYEVALDGGTPEPVLTNGSLLITGLTPGDHAVALLDVADNCVLSETNPLTVTVVSGATVNASFNVSCSPLLLAAPGHEIAFRSDGEVYLLSADGTTRANLTNNPSHDGEPAWSPDGKTIAFGSERTGIRQIYVMNADGSGQTQRTSGALAGNAAWSPDGSKIAFMGTDTGNQEIYVMNPDGSGIARLTSTGYADGPAWSPDGTKIAFTGGGDFDTEIFVMDADGSNVTRLTKFQG